MDNTTIFEFGSEIFEDGLLFFVIRAVSIWVFAWFLNRIIQRMSKKVGKSENAKTSMQYIAKIIKALIYVMALIAILGKVRAFKGIGTAMLGATSVITVVVGLAAQETFGNFIAGFFLAMYQPFKVGDFVSLPEKNILGTVNEITFRHTVLKTIENAMIIIPNSVMNTAIIEDRMYGQTICSRFIRLQVAYGTNIRLMKKIIGATVVSKADYIDTRTAEEKKAGVLPVMIRVDDMLDSGLLVTFPVNAADLKTLNILASDIRIELLQKFAENNIEIPYKKIDIYTK
jgi:small-conductance mechanosensitive channel